MKFSVITLFPEQISNHISYSILKRSREKGLIDFNIVNLRDFGIGKHKSVDDKPYGGGAGMVMRVDVLHEAIKSVKTGKKGELTLLLDPQGEVYRQETAEKLSLLDHIILICGHYEGVDERVRNYVDAQISLGDFILTGGEIPAIAVIDSIIRLVPGVLKDPTATIDESFSSTDGNRFLEGPQYTRPDEFLGEKVPEVYLSGDPKKIKQFKSEQAFKKTSITRPDLLS